MSKKRFIVVVLLVILLFSLIVNAQSKTSTLKPTYKETIGSFSSRTNALGDLILQGETSTGKSEISINQKILRNLDTISVENDGDKDYISIKPKDELRKTGKYVSISDIGSVPEIKIPFSSRYDSTIEPLGNRLRLTFDSTTKKSVPVTSGSQPVKTKGKDALVSKEQNLNAEEIKEILSSFQKLNKDYLPIETKEILAALKEQGREFAGNLEIFLGEESLIVSVNTVVLRKQLEKLYEKGLLRGRISLNTRTDEDGNIKIAMMDLEKAKINPMSVATAVRYNPSIEESLKAPPIRKKIEIELLGQIGEEIQSLDKRVYSQLPLISSIIASTKILDPVNPTSLNDLIKQKEEKISALKKDLKKAEDNFNTILSKERKEELNRQNTELKQLNKIAKKINKEEQKR